MAAREGDDTIETINDGDSNHGSDHGDEEVHQDTAQQHEGDEAKLDETNTGEQETNTPEAKTVDSGSEDDEVTFKPPRKTGRRTYGERINPDSEDELEVDRSQKTGPTVDDMAKVLGKQFLAMQIQWEMLQKREDAQVANMMWHIESLRKEMAEKQAAERQAASRVTADVSVAAPGRAEGPRVQASQVSKLMTFDGSQPWLEYQAHLEEYAAAFGWDPDQKAQMLCVSLRGAAQGILLGLSESDRRDYGKVIEALRQNFCPAEKIYTYQAELQARKLKPEETLSEFARDVRTSTSLAYPEADAGTKEVLMRTHFCNGLTDPQMRLSVAKSHPRTLAQALAYATEFDSIVGATKAEEAKPAKKWARQTKNEVTETGTPEQRQQLDALTKKLEELSLKLERQTSRPSQPWGRRDQRPGNTPRKPNPDIECWHCAGKGHTQYWCPERKRGPVKKPETPAEKEQPALNKEGSRQ